jgi:hypothetical protein
MKNGAKSRYTSDSNLLLTVLYDGDGDVGRKSVNFQQTMKADVNHLRELHWTYLFIFVSFLSSGLDQLLVLG